MVRTPVLVAYVAWWGGGLALATKRETSAEAEAMGDDIHRKGRENCLPPLPTYAQVHHTIQKDNGRI